MIFFGSYCVGLIVTGGFICSKLAIGLEAIPESDGQDGVSFGAVFGDTNKVLFGII